MISNTRLKYLYKNRKRIWQSIEKAIVKHGDSMNRLIFMAWGPTATWHSMAGDVMREFPYLNKTQIELFIYSNDIENKFGPIKDWGWTL